MNIGMTDTERALRALRSELWAISARESQNMPQLCQHLISTSGIISNYIRAFEEVRTNAQVTRSA